MLKTLPQGMEQASKTCFESELKGALTFIHRKMAMN